MEYPWAEDFAEEVISRSLCNTTTDRSRGSFIDSFLGRGSAVRCSLPIQTYNMNTETRDTPNVDWGAIEDGLREIRDRPKLSTLIGDPKKTYRQQLRLTAIENALLKTINVALTAIVSRGVAHALVHRLALSLLAEQCTAALRDPAAAARLKAKLLAVREERRSEHA